MVELAERAAERMPPVELVVAVGRDDERGERLDAARDDAQHVEGRLVRPVHVFDQHDRGRGSLQLAHERGGDLVRLDAAGCGPLELAAGGCAMSRNGPSGRGV